MRPSRCTLLFLALPILVAGCEGPAPTPSVAEGEARACDNEYMPVVEGATWTYKRMTSQGDRTQQAVILDVSENAFVLGVTLTDISYEEAWMCTEEGLVQLETAGSPYTAAFAGPDGNVRLSTVDSDGVTLPASFDVGDEWDQTTQVQISSSAFNGLATISHEFSAVRSEPITVAGTEFQAVVVEVSSTLEIPQFSFEFKSVQWYVRGVGLVKLEGQMTEPEFDVSYELVGYSVP